MGPLAILPKLHVRFLSAEVADLSKLFNPLLTGSGILELMLHKTIFPERVIQSFVAFAFALPSAICT